MKLGIYSDPHFSLTSSILSRVNGYKYSSRLDMIVDSFKWMYELFESKGVDLVINGGDMVSSDILRPEENSAIYEALSYRTGIPEHYILGNHEIKDKNKKFSSVSLLRGYDDIMVYNSMEVQTIGDINIIYFPFTSDKEDHESLYEFLDKSDKSKKYYLVTHASYIGESYNSYVETEGLDKVKLMDSYSNLKAIFNGHIHNVKDEGIYHQIGSLTGNSFSDNYDAGYPGVMIYNTKDDTFERYDNPKSALFFKIKSDTVRGLYYSLIKLPSDNGKCLRVEVPYSVKDNVSEYLVKNSEKYNILEHRVKVKYEPLSSSEVPEIESFSSYKSSHDALTGFVNSQESLPYPKEDILNFLDKYVK